MDPMEKFIKCVRQHPCLWDLTNPAFRDMQAKEEAWAAIVTSYDDHSVIPHVKEAKVKWRKLRDGHRDALKRAKLGRNKLLPAQITTWKYARSMQFLEPHMKYRITENIDTCSEDVTTNTKSEATTSNLDVSYSNKRKCVEDPADTTPSLQQDGDALVSFFNCMLVSTRKMPTWMQTQIKKKIFAVIIEAEEQLSNEEESKQEDSNDEYAFNHVIKTECFTEESDGFT